jgi:hypothetical protein
MTIPQAGRAVRFEEEASGDLNHVNSAFSIV